ncbi:hypothetical protein LguiA_012967 [Lonicera macranthoides]
MAELFFGMERLARTGPGPGDVDEYAAEERLARTGPGPGDVDEYAAERKLLVFESIRANAEVKQIATLASVVSCQLYLVESSDGELIMVKRHSRIQPREGYNESLYWPWKTYGFTVYKHDPSNLSWVELKDLGDDMLFLGYNSSLSFSCRDFGGDKSNRIYFTDDFNEFHWKGVKGGQDIGVFKLEKGSVEPLQGFECDPNHVWPPPVWVTPNPS